MTDEPGVLGNLPRSRPGQRSSKRTGSQQRAAPPQSKARAARPAPASRVVRSAGQTPAPAPPAARNDPLGGAVKVAVKVADAYLKTAGAVLRRLPGR